jgi:hypothetical protein
MTLLNFLPGLRAGYLHFCHDVSPPLVTRTSPVGYLAFLLMKTIERTTPYEESDGRDFKNAVAHGLPSDSENKIRAGCGTFAANLARL